LNSSAVGTWQWNSLPFIFAEKTEQRIKILWDEMTTVKKEKAKVI